MRTWKFDEATFKRFEDDLFCLCITPLTQGPQ